MRVREFDDRNRARHGMRENVRRRPLRESWSSGGLLLGDLLHNYVSQSQYVRILDDSIEDSLIAEGTVFEVLRSGMLQYHLNDVVTGLKAQHDTLTIFGMFIG